MDEPRDDIDSWLGERVTPLLPHPGAFDRVRKRARRRKAGQAAIAAGGAAVIVVAAVTVPHLVISQLHPTVQQSPLASSSPTPHPSHSPTAVIPSHPKPSPSPSATATTPPPVPGNFQPSSVTFVGTLTGWVIGQAGTPGQCANPNPYICTSMAVTENGGQTWQGLPAPDAGPPNGAHGVSGVRSFQGADGWAFGPELWATHNGGQSWTRIGTHGMRVTDLETVNGRVFALWAQCAGGGAAFAAHCTSFSLYSSPTGVDQWAPVTGATGLAMGYHQDTSAQIVLTGTTGYLLSPSGTLYSGNVSGGAWGPVQNGSNNVRLCRPGLPQADGVPSGNMLATTGTDLMEVCNAKTLVYSADGGHTWQDAGSDPLPGAVTSLAGTPAGQVVLATSDGIAVSSNVPAVAPATLQWRTVHGATLPGGFTYVGMTTDSQGVAIPADQSLHEVLFTYDGGRHWVSSALP